MLYQIIFLGLFSATLCAMEIHIEETQTQNRSIVQRLRNLLPVQRYVQEHTLPETDEGDISDARIREFLTLISNGYDYKSQIALCLQELNVTRRNIVYSRFQTRAKKLIEKERMDALLVMLTEQMAEANKTSKKELAIAQQQLVSMDRLRLMYQRSGYIAMLITLMSLAGNVYQLYVAYE